MSQIEIHWATFSELEQIVPLFDGYRQFYELPSNMELARALLIARMGTGQSKVALATNESGVACGFIQLYPLFSSLSLSVETSKTWLLNDLFVAKNGRSLGVGRSLMDFVQSWAAGEPDVGALMLETAKTNVLAQGLYESQGWARDEAYFVYHLAVK